MNTTLLFLIDTLNIGGAERVVVNLANELVLRQYKVTVCVTRQTGPLQRQLSPQVNFFCLNRRLRIDLPAMLRLMKFVKKQNVQIIHAHSSSLFIALIVRSFFPKVKVIWHIHSGALVNETNLPFLYQSVARYADGIITVNQSLADWVVTAININPKKVWYLPNFVQTATLQPDTNLPGVTGHRLVCVANLRPEKDHLTLVRAMKFIVDSEPHTYLILVGANSVPSVKEKIESNILELGLLKNITWLGERDDVQNILANCTIGVLSSASEGLPLALLEYGSAGLPVVVTSVGECAQVLDNGNAGTLVSPHSPQDLANGILFYLQNPELAKGVGKKFQMRVKNNYSAEAVLQKLEKIYHQVLN